MTEILSELFTKSGTDEIGKLCYLLQGRVAPLYEPIEFGVGDKLMVRAIGKAYGVEDNAVDKAFGKSGDLGIVAEKFWDCGNHKKDSRNLYRLTIGDVFTRLWKLTQMGGEGSQDQKIEALADLLGSMDALSARYLARIPLDKLRLGFSDMTILDALSWMLGKDKSQRPRLEEVYNIRPDIGLLAAQIKAHGIAGLSHVKAVVGAPILAALCQRLPTADEMIKKMGEVAVEPKYDGVRCVGGYTGIFVKNRGYLSVRDICVGDDVLTHKGRYRKVDAIHKRLQRSGEQLFRLQTMLGDAFTISGDHPVLTSYKDSARWVPASSLTQTNWVVFPVISQSNASYQSILELTDEAGYRKRIPCNELFFRLLGFWIGDGYTNNGHQSERVGFTFNAKTEQTLAREYASIISTILGIKSISRYIHNGGLNLYWRDPPFRRWLIKEFRFDTGTNHGKQIPEWMVSISRNNFLAFMQGWQEADGTERHNGGNRITTKEKTLAHMATILGYTFEYPLGVRKIRAKATTNGVAKTYYEIIMPGTNRYVKKVDGLYLVKIQEIKKIRSDPRAHLYDLQVAQDESYCTSLAILHNCQIHYRTENGKQKTEIKTFSRNLENTTAMFPELQNVGDQLDAHDVILDSEAVGMDPATGKLIPFQETSTRKRKHDIQASLLKVPLKFFVFDILYKDGVDLLNRPLSERRSILKSVVKKGQNASLQGDMLVVSPEIVTSSPSEIRAYHDEQIQKGLEGAVVKKWHSPYEPGRRGYSWVKFKEEEGKTGKLTDTIDAVVMGYYRGEGKRAGFGIGAFLVGVKKGEGFVTITKIGTGVSDEMWKELERDFRRRTSDVRPKEYGEVPTMLEPDVWINPKIVVEIAGDDLTKSSTHGAGVAVRFPRLVRIRTDKSPSQATSIKEVETMYAQQGSTGGVREDYGKIKGNRRN